MNPYLNDLEAIRSRPEISESPGTCTWGLARPVPFSSLTAVVVRAVRRAVAAWWVLMGRGEVVVYADQHHRLYRRALRCYYACRNAGMSDTEILAEIERTEAEADGPFGA